MLKYISLFLLLLLPFSAYCQANKADSLKQSLSVEKNDTARLVLYAQLFDYYQEVKPQTAIQYGREGLKLAQKLRLPFQEAYTLNNLGCAQLTTGSFTESLQSFLKGLALMENQKTSETTLPLRYLQQLPFLEVMPDVASYQFQLEYDLHHNLSQLYDALGQQDKSLQEYRVAKAIAEKSKLPYPLYETAANEGNLYFERGKYKQALAYFKKSYELGEKIKNKKYLAYPLTYIANTYVKLGDGPAAKQYFWKAIASAKSQNNVRGMLEPYTGLVNLYHKSGDVDSSLWYAHQSLKIGKSINATWTINQVSNFLADHYKRQGLFDSALYYREAAFAIRDASFNAQKNQEMQNIVVAENQRKAEIAAAAADYKNRLQKFGMGAGLAFLALVALLLWRNNRQRQQANAQLNQQKNELEVTLVKLKTTQAQLIQSEKMASLGELTAGIAHEIQNPLNFVNNFSEVSSELVEELEAELQKGDYEEALALAQDVKGNLQKINHHGKRADGIVKGMLEHSRTSTGRKEPTDVNALAEEYLRLSYHGLRAKDKSFNADFSTDFTQGLHQLEVIPQDLGRVFLNLFNNAFYAVQQKRKTAPPDYQPHVKVATSASDSEILIKVIDNGTGIPKEIQSKILQPFFTTKPTGQGTGLGLSLSYDIIVKGHGGSLEVNTLQGEFSEFIIHLPVN